MHVICDITLHMSRSMMSTAHSAAKQTATIGTPVRLEANENLLKNSNNNKKYCTFIDLREALASQAQICFQGDVKSGTIKGV